MKTSNNKKEFWNKKERAMARLYQQEVLTRLTAVNSQLVHIETYDKSFYRVARSAATALKEIAQRLLILEFQGKKQRHQFITYRQFENLVNDFNGAMKVWNITMCSPEARASKEYASLHASRTELSRLEVKNNAQSQ